MNGTTTNAAEPTPEDEDLVARARRGEAHAIERLVERHQGVVFRFLVSLLGDDDAAADVAQETFIRAMGKLEGFRGDATFRTWLLAIARNEARGWIRKRGRRGEAPLDAAPNLPDAGPSPAEAAEMSADMVRVRKALARLPEKQRLSVALRIFDGLSFREVAEATGSTEGAARVNYHHGIRRLREWLDE